jgi:hypothetical protein
VGRLRPAGARPPTRTVRRRGNRARTGKGRRRRPARRPHRPSARFRKEQGRKTCSPVMRKPPSSDCSAAC